MQLQEQGQAILNQQILGETLIDWLLLAAVWAVAAVVFVIVHHFVRDRFTRMAARTSNKVDDVAAALLKRTRTYFLIALGLYAALAILDMDGQGADLVARFMFILLMLQVGFWVNSLITLWIGRFREQKLETDASAVTTVSALGVLARIVVWFMAFLFVLGNFGVEITPLIAGAGIGGIAIALAVQNILSDLFASLSIVLDKPFVVGDFLIVGGDFLGTVEHIGLKTTRVRSLSGEQIVFSNSDLLNSRIRNYKRMFERRVIFRIGVTYQTHHQLLEKIPGWLKEIVESQERVRFDRAHWAAFGAFSLDFEIVYYVLAPEYNIYMDIQQAINLAIHRRFEDEGIEFAYPTQTLFVSKEDRDAGNVLVE